MELWLAPRSCGWFVGWYWCCPTYILMLFFYYTSKTQWNDLRWRLNTVWLCWIFKIGRGREEPPGAERRVFDLRAAWVRVFISREIRSGARRGGKNTSLRLFGSDLSERIFWPNCVRCLIGISSSITGTYGQLPALLCRMSQRKTLQFSVGALLLLLPWFGGLVLGEVSSDFSQCLDFFYNKTPPQGITDVGYQPICQRYRNQYRFASLYHRQHREPLYSAYILSPADGKRPNVSWMYEPQVSRTMQYNVQEQAFPLKTNCILLSVTVSDMMCLAMLGLHVCD